MIGKTPRRWPSAKAQSEISEPNPYRARHRQPQIIDDGMQPKPTIFALSRARIARGTGSSNPSPSRRESANHRFLTGGSDVRFKQSGTPKGARGPHLTGDANAWSNGNRQRRLPPPKRTSLSATSPFPLHPRCSKPPSRRALSRRSHSKVQNQIKHRR
jgi:hypothetical protein